jgi:hypothetical protein
MKNSSPKCLLAAAVMLLTAQLVDGQTIYVSRMWHNHQPIYWPEWNSNWNGQPNRVQFAKDSITLKAGQVYDSGQAHPDNNLDEIFGVEDRKKAYQAGPKDSLVKVDQSGGYLMSYSGSLINNVHGLGNSGHPGYGSGWWDGNRTARTWTTPAGSRRLEMVGFTYHHSLGAVLPKSVFRKEIQIFHEAAYKAWNTGSITNRSRGFFPTEMAFSRHMVDVLADEGYQWVIVASHHLSRTLPGYMGSTYTTPQSNSWQIFSSPPNNADQINSVSGGGWWFGTGNVGETAYNHSPYAYQLHKAKYVNPETGAEKTIIMVPSDDVQSYKAGYSGWQKNLIDNHIAPHATDAGRPCIILPSTDGDNAWGGGNDSWQINAPAFMNNGTYPATAVQDFVNSFGPAADTVHVEDGAWIFPESDYGSPQFLKWVEPPAGGQVSSRVPNTQVDMETPGFTPKFYSWAPVMAGANWCETAEQMWTDENGAGSVANWKIADPYDNMGSSPGYTNPNIVERAWHIYLAGLDSGFNYYGGDGNDDEVKSSLATRRAYEMLSSYVDARKSTNDRTPPTVFKPQRFPYNPGGYTFGWFNIIPGNNNALKKMNSEFYIWTHAYDVSGITSIAVKVRTDNDGVNPLASNQNETYAGGAEVGSWVSIPMTKRILPQTAADLTAAANNSKIAYFEGARSPVVADYYFARIDNSRLPDFRGKLLDYYIEATDARNNTSKSEIQHVFVEDDGNGTPPPAPSTPTGLNAVASSSTQIDVSWNATQYATSYQLKRNGVVIATQAGTTFSDIGRMPNTTYTYTVAAQNVTATSPDSASVNATTPNGPANFVMDGAADSPGYLITSNSMTLYAAIRGTQLYVATWSTGNGGGANDHFIHVSDTLLNSATTTAPWTKSGSIAVPAAKPFLSAESTNSYAGWQNLAGGVSVAAAKAASSSGQLEGTIDLVQAFGSMPSTLYLAAVAYQTGNSGASTGFLASQCPAGNGNNDVDPNEFLTVPVTALMDSNNDGILDQLDPATEFRVHVAMNASGFPVITWPSVPGRSYQVECRDDLGSLWNNFGGAVGTPSGQILQSVTDSSGQPRRFYRVRAISP